MDDPTQAQAPAEPAYAYKPSLMGAAWLLRLTPDHLEWSVGRRSGQRALSRHREDPHVVQAGDDADAALSDRDLGARARRRS